MSNAKARFSWFGLLLGPLIFFHHRYLTAGLVSVLLQAFLILGYAMTSGSIADALSLILTIYNIAHGFWRFWFERLPLELQKVSLRPRWACMLIGIFLSILAITPIVYKAVSAVSLALDMI